MPEIDPLREYAPLFMFGLIAVIFAIVAIVNSAMEGKRRERLFAFAQSAGLEMVDPLRFGGQPPTGFMSLFSSTGDYLESGILARFQGFQPFGVGHGFMVKNLMVGGG